jgi:hypothetical protein
MYMVIVGAEQAVIPRSHQTQRYWCKYIMYTLFQMSDKQIEMIIFFKYHFCINKKKLSLDGFIDKNIEIWY